MLPELYIVGAGGFGRELYCWLRDDSGWGRDWKFSGFLDDNELALQAFSHEAEVVAPLTDFIPESNQLFACGIGNINIKRNACKPLLDRGAQFITVVHPTATVGSRVSLGKGVVVCPGVILTCDIHVGDMAMFNLASTSGHDVHVGAWTTLSPHCDLTGGVTVGQNVFIGVGARILPGISVGDDAFIGAGAVVMRDVSNGQKVFGNPARPFA